MSDVVFLLDASALARKFYDDIGKRNLNTIFNHPNCTFCIPNIGIVETASALLAAYNTGAISYAEYQAAISTIFSMVKNEELLVLSLDKEFVKESILILEQYKTQKGKSFNGVDAIYIILSREIAKELINKGVRTIFVTSDNNLYNAAKDETLFEAFHFWTCDLGCGHVEFIPAKGKKDRSEEYRECKKCGNKIKIKEKYISPNTCPKCGLHCAECSYYLCPSTYIPVLGQN